MSVYAQTWLDTLRVEDSTRAGYEGLVKRYVIPTLGSFRIDAIKPTKLAQVYLRLERDGGRGGAPLSANTVRKTHVVIGSILDAAVDDGYVRQNAARRTRVVKAPTAKQVKAEAPELEVWTAEQLTAFLKWDRHIYDDSDYTLWLVLAHTGMRRGEALGLRWKDFDVTNQRISVRRAANSIKHGETKGTKSGKPRVIDLDESVVEVLKAWKAVRGSLSLDLARADAVIFGDTAGNVINPNRVTGRWAARVAAARRAGVELPKLALHGLRHTHATNLLQAGVHPRIVQERLGHADISITMGLYSHVTESMQRDAVARYMAVMQAEHKTEHKGPDLGAV
nr:site-specific integrase [Pseudoclavibacter helvolus]